MLSMSGDLKVSHRMDSNGACRAVVRSLVYIVHPTWFARLLSTFQVNDSGRRVDACGKHELSVTRVNCRLPPEMKL